MRNHHTTVVIFVLLLMVLMENNCAHADDWPSALHDPGNTCSTSDKVRLPLTLAWSKKNIGLINGYSVASGEIVYIPTDKQLVAINLLTGKFVWSIQGSFISLCICDSVLFALSNVIDSKKAVYRYYLYSINPITGKLHWRTKWNRKRTFTSDLVAISSYNGRLYIADTDGQFQEINPIKGSIVKSISFPGWALGSPAFFQTDTIWASKHWLTSLSLKTWTIENRDFYDGGNCYPIAINKYICLQTMTSRTQVFEVHNRKLSFLYRFPGTIGIGHGVATLGGGIVFSNSNNPEGYLSAHRIQDGKLIWQAPMLTAGLVSTSRNYIFIIGSNRVRDKNGIPQGWKITNSLFALNPSTGKILAKYSLSSKLGNFPCVPLICTNRIVVAMGGTVYCFK